MGRMKSPEVAENFRRSYRTTREDFSLNSFRTRKRNTLEVAQYRKTLTVELKERQVHRARKYVTTSWRKAHRPKWYAIVTNWAPTCMKATATMEVLGWDCRNRNDVVRWIPYYPSKRRLRASNGQKNLERHPISKKRKYSSGKLVSPLKWQLFWWLGSF